MMHIHSQAKQQFLPAAVELHLQAHHGCTDPYDRDAALLVINTHSAFFPFQHEEYEMHFLSPIPLGLPMLSLPQ